MFKSNNVLLKNIVIIAEKMNYEDNPRIFSGSDYYFTWENKTEEDVKAILEKTGIECRVTDSGILLVPQYTNFKSEKEKELLLKLSQYGPLMMYLDLAKKSSSKDLKIMCKELFGIFYKKLGEEEFNVLLKNIIGKISEN